MVVFRFFTVPSCGCIFVLSPGRFICSLHAQLVVLPMNACMDGWTRLLSLLACLRACVLACLCACVLTLVCMRRDQLWFLRSAFARSFFRSRLHWCLKVPPPGNQQSTTGTARTNGRASERMTLLSWVVRITEECKGTPSRVGHRKFHNHRTNGERTQNQLTKRHADTNTSAMDVKSWQ